MMSTPNATARRRPGRAILSVVLIVLGSLLTPVAIASGWAKVCLLYTSDAADGRSSVDLGGRRIIKKQKHTKKNKQSYD